MARPRLLVVGLDVGDGDLARRWIGRGGLPTLGSLAESGGWATLDTPADALHVSGWPSLYTGAAPGEHGVYFTFQPRAGLQGWEAFSAGQYGRPTLWSRLARHGVRCTVFDAPYTHPEEGPSATQVFEWGTWAHHWRPSSSPPGLFRRLTRACGRYPLGLEALDLGLDPLDAADMSRRLVAAARAKTGAAAWLMDAEPWDLFFVVFGETHPGAHYCREDAGEGGDADPPRLRVVYEEIDRGVATLLERAGAGTSVLVASTDGTGPNHAGWHLLPEVLRRLGFLVEPGGGAGEGGGRDGSPPAGRRSRSPLRRIRDAIPDGARKALLRRLPHSVRQRLGRRVQMSGIDWSRTRAYCLPTDLEGCIRVNLRGREPLGIVAPGAEFRTVCEELAHALSELSDPATGRRVVRDVLLTDDVFPGPRRDRLPDVIVRWVRGNPIAGLASPAIGAVTGVSPDGRPGTHAPPGFLLAAGEAFPDGARPFGHVCDVAPALLERYGAPLPEYLERPPAARNLRPGEER